MTRAEKIEMAAKWVCAWERGVSRYEAAKHTKKIPKAVVTAKLWICRDGLRDAVARLREILTEGNKDKS